MYLLFNLIDPVKISKVPELKYVKTPVDLIELLIDHSGESLEFVKLIVMGVF